MKHSTSTLRFILGFPFGLLAECFSRLALKVSGNQLDVDFNYLAKESVDASSALVAGAAEISHEVVKNWAHYSQTGIVPNHQIGVIDTRKKAGQLTVGIGELGRDLNECLGAVFEVCTNPLGVSSGDVPCIRISFDGNDEAFSIYKLGNQLLISPEAGVNLQSFTGKIGAASGECGELDRYYFFER